jgi:hypothetical protein
MINPDSVARCELRYWQGSKAEPLKRRAAKTGYPKCQNHQQRKNWNKKSEIVEDITTDIYYINSVQEKNTEKRVP